MSDGYNGYTNYETWVTSLWMDNEPHTNEYLYELANREAVHETEIAELVDKADDLEGYVRDMLFDVDPYGGTQNQIHGLRSDLLTHAVGEVNWREIIESHMEIPVA